MRILILCQIVQCLAHKYLITYYYILYIFINDRLLVILLALVALYTNQLIDELGLSKKKLISGDCIFSKQITVATATEY